MRTFLTNRVKSWVFNSTFGKERIKEVIQQQLQQAFQALPPEAHLEALPSIQSSPARRALLKECYQTIEQLRQSLVTEGFLEPWVKICAAHLHEYEDTSAFKNKLITSQATQGLQTYTTTVFNFSDYQLLAQHLMNAQQFTTLSPNAQQEVLAFLTNTQFIEKISQQHQTLALTTIQSEIRVFTHQLSTELSLSNSEITQINVQLDHLFAQHLDRFDKLRQEVASHLKDFLQDEHQRLVGLPAIAPLSAAPVFIPQRSLKRGTDTRPTTEPKAHTQLKTKLRLTQTAPVE